MDCRYNSPAVTCTAEDFTEFWDARLGRCYTFNKKDFNGERNHLFIIRDSSLISIRSMVTVYKFC